jgi:uncharacterized membrane protein
MSFVVEPLYVGAILCLLVALAEWLSRRKHFRYLGSALIVILAAAILANVGLLPSSRNAPALYEGIIGRGDLRLPGILAGSLGNAIGT